MAGSSSQQTGANRQTSFDVTGIINLVPADLHKRLLYANGKLRLSSLLKALQEKAHIPELFLDEFNKRYPDSKIDKEKYKETPVEGGGETTVPQVETVAPNPEQVPDKGPIVEEAGEGDDDSSSDEGSAYLSTRNHSRSERPHTPPEIAMQDIPEEEDEAEDDAADSEVGYTWYTSSFVRNRDTLNKRNSDGTLRPLREFEYVAIESGIEVGPNKAVPHSLITPEWLEHWDEILTINSREFYEPERYALGHLHKSMYFLIPANWQVPICPINAIGAGLTKYKLTSLNIASIYTLAKNQALKLGLTEDNAMRWGALRVEAFKTGWFDYQKFTMHQELPDGFLGVFVRDGAKLREYMAEAYTLCGFLPLLSEFHFRVYGNTYNKNNASEYMDRARRLATAAQIADSLNFLEPDILFGQALGWIGVKRPMLAIRNTVARTHFANIFQIRAKSAPAGQAVITTSVAVIRALTSANWWLGIKTAGNYDDSVLVKVADAILENPWKYHIMAHLYGVTLPTEAELREVEIARNLAIMYSPILQAYVDTVAGRTDLGKAKALKKYADANSALYVHAQAVFRKANKVRGEKIADLFANQVFQPVRALEQNRANFIAS